MKGVGSFPCQYLFFVNFTGGFLSSKRQMKPGCDAKLQKDRPTGFFFDKAVKPRKLSGVFLVNTGNHDFSAAITGYFVETEGLCLLHGTTGRVTRRGSQA
ncbi:MAG TPA: hypothetical protein VMH87_01730 [Pseudomonadales bacterium]|nr:hypothetical protein [Pseudomonadales bacterium]